MKIWSQIAECLWSTNFWDLPKSFFFFHQTSGVVSNMRSSNTCGWYEMGTIQATQSDRRGSRTIFNGMRSPSSHATSPFEWIVYCATCISDTLYTLSWYVSYISLRRWNIIIIISCMFWPEISAKEKSAWPTSFAIQPLCQRQSASQHVKVTVCRVMMSPLSAQRVVSTTVFLEKCSCTCKGRDHLRWLMSVFHCIGWGQLRWWCWFTLDQWPPLCSWHYFANT